MNRHYVLIRNKYEKNKIDINPDKLTNGFHIHPKNSSEYTGLEVREMTINSKNFVERIVKKKTGRKLEGYIQYLMSLLDDDNGESGDFIGFVLNDVMRFRGIIKAKYAKYLDEHYTELLLKKLDLLEHELKMKAYYINEKENMYTETRGKSR